MAGVGIAIRTPKNAGGLYHLNRVLHKKARDHY